jgi:biotinidase
MIYFITIFSAVQYFQAWAFSNNVNLIVSGLNNPQQSQSGSGIYAGKLGPIVSTLQGSNATYVSRKHSH